MARVSEHAKAMAQLLPLVRHTRGAFHGWYYDLLALWAHGSTASIWMRLPHPGDGAHLLVGNQP